MRKYDHLIIGGGIAGVTAAEELRKLAPDASVAVIGDEPHALYSRVLLPRVVEGKLPSEKAYLRKDGQLEVNGIAYLPGVRVEKVDVDAREVRASDGESYGYGTLLVATGGRPRRLACPGGDDADILHFQTIEDAEAFRDAKGGTAAVVGAGFIALELLMGFVRLGMKPTALLRKDRFFSAALDEESARRIEEELEANGVVVRKGVQVVKVARGAGPSDADRAPSGVGGDAFALSLDDGTEMTVDRFGVGIGLVPNVECLEGTGIDVDGGVLADASLRASASSVFAAGDVARFPDPCSGETRVVGNWQNAMFQGRHVAANMHGDDLPYTRTTAYTIAVFGLSFASVGAPDAKADERIVLASDETVLQLVCKDGRVVGATNVGKFADRAKVVALIDSRRTLDDHEMASLRSGEFPA